MPPKSAVVRDSAIAAEKRGLRALARLGRAKLAAARPDAGITVRDALMEGLARLGLDGATGATVAAYWPIGDELDIRPALEALDQAGFRLALPAVAGRARPLEFRAFRPGDALGEAGFGLSEPLPGQPVLTPRALLVPLLAFDDEGYRLGYGAGYYDMTLDALGGAAVLAVGVGFAGQRMERVPREPHDRPMHWLLTERGLQPVAAARSA